MNTPKACLDVIESALNGFVPEEKGAAAKVYEAARYSLLAGGKRVRPVLLCEFASLYGVPFETALPYACALECIHTYSLIHDDMPCMDNDDLRRGRATNHKVYGEAMALLAGDALLNRAYEIMLSAALSDGIGLKTAGYIADCAGVNGMVGGQCIDLVNENVRIDADLLGEMHAKKTGALLRAACVGGALLGTSDRAQLDAARDYAAELGLAFQIIDDILDVEGDAAVLGKNTGMDAADGKNTFVSVLGLDEAKRRAALHTTNALAALDRLPHSDFLADFTLKLSRRDR